MSNDLHTLSGAYAVDALSPEEAAQFRQHLAVCPACQQEVRELRQAAAQMGASEAVAPPAHLKARVLAAAQREPQLPPRVRAPQHTAGTTNRLPRLLAAAAAVLLVAAGGIGLARLLQPSEVERVFAADDAEVVQVETANGGELRVAMSGSLEEMAVDTDALPALPSARVYQLWAIRDGVPAPAGLIEDLDEGAAMALPEAGTVVAVTIEPAGGSVEPTTDPIAVVDPADV